MARRTSIAEGKKRFSSIIRSAAEKKEETVVTKHGRPVAAILPIEKYRMVTRREAYRKILEMREAFSKAGLQAGEIFRISRKELEEG